MTASVSSSNSASTLCFWSFIGVCFWPHNNNLKGKTEIFGVRQVCYLLTSQSAVARRHIHPVWTSTYGRGRDPRIAFRGWNTRQRKWGNTGKEGREVLSRVTVRRWRRRGGGRVWMSHRSDLSWRETNLWMMSETGGIQGGICLMEDQ